MMHRDRLALVAALCSLTAVACTYDPKVDANQFPCKANHDCPQNFRCVKAVPGALVGVCCDKKTDLECLATAAPDGSVGNPPLDAASAGADATPKDVEDSGSARAIDGSGDASFDQPALPVDVTSPPDNNPDLPVSASADASSDAIIVATPDAPGAVDAPALDTVARGPDAPISVLDANEDAPYSSEATIADSGTLNTKGGACSTASECITGICEQGVCCETVCGSTCRSCALPGKPGTCTLIPDGQDPLDQCADQGVATCGTDGMCDGSGACRKYGKGSVCSAQTCISGTEKSAGTCDGLGTCQPGNSRGCAPASCNVDGTACFSTCTTDNQCVPPNSCNNSTCSLKPIAAACVTSSQCANGLCEQGVCCTSRCDATCKSCAVPGLEGGCSNIPAGQDYLSQCDDQGAGSCGFDGVCNGNGACRLYSSSTVCAAPTCQAGVQTGQRTCNGTGTCQGGMSTNCGAYVCETSACKTQCSSDADCAPPNTCVGTFCGLTGNSGATCGPLANENCAVALPVPGGNFNRGNNPSYPATVSDFLLDKYEVTVGRFRLFVIAGKGTQASPPASGAGVHPLIPNSGWDSTWNTYLAADTAAFKVALNCNAGYSTVYQTWTDSPLGNENRPMDCVNWYEAFAFCAWDGGRLPTETEWGYAAAGGSEQRVYPWGATVPSNNANLAIYGCYFNGTGTCTGVTNIAPVGSVVAGNGKWGHADLAGNLWEFALDWIHNPYANANCNNCANLTPNTNRVVLGGGYDGVASNLANANNRFSVGPTYRYGGYGLFGFRCARD